MNIESITDLYFTDLLSIVCNILAASASLKSKKKKDSVVITIYIYISLAFNVFVYVTGLILEPSRRLDHLLFAVMNVYTIVECTLLFLFIKEATEQKNLKRFLVGVYGAFVTFWFFIFVWHSKFLTHSASVMAGVESFTIILLSVTSLNAIIKTERVSIFLKSSKFYFFSAIVLYFSYSLPHFLSMDLISDADPHIEIVFEIVNLLFLSIFYLLIRKGFLCNTRNLN